MSAIMVRVHNIETDEIIDREATADELAQMAVDAQKAQEAADAKAQEAATKAALLERLGITADEAKLLLS